eukprot:scaffold37018_cov73-Phaeocystis_antarctica.AAC.1
MPAVYAVRACGGDKHDGRAHNRPSRHVAALSFSSTLLDCSVTAACCFTVSFTSVCCERDVPVIRVIHSKQHLAARERRGPALGGPGSDKRRFRV